MLNCGERGKGAELFLARQFAAAVTALLLIAGAFFVFLFTVSDLQAKDPGSSCEDAAEVAVLSSPIAPWKGAPLRVVFAAEKPLEGELSLIAPDGKVAAKSRERHGGPPYFWFAEVASPAAGMWHATLAREAAPAECSTITREIAVRRAQPRPPRATPGSVWPVRNTWNRATENLYSAWIEKLFDAPLDEALSWPALHEVLRDQSRNFLFNHLGLREDEKGLIIRPDCADLPYFLRAYFAFKMGLPFGYSKCTRGGGGEPPKCPQWWNIQKEEPPPAPPEQETASAGLFGMFGEQTAPPAARLPPRPQGLVPGFGYYLRTTVANGVHSGTGRTAASDDNTDYYPVPLKAGDAAPGDRVRRSVRARLGARAARAAVGRRGGRPPRRRRAARRDGRAQALLARQFPVRAGSRAREPRVQALPADRAREERRLAAADQRTRSRKIRSTAIFRSINRSSGSKTFTIEWMT